MQSGTRAIKYHVLAVAIAAAALAAAGPAAAGRTRAAAPVPPAVWAVALDETSAARVVRSEGARLRSAGINAVVVTDLGRGGRAAGEARAATARAGLLAVVPELLRAGRKAVASAAPRACAARLGICAVLAT